uniref:Endonuclease/exonuclease/phosphatase domain-containing protein n=1 Tax=Scylla olivacea TaxID=85551 RepID=A0A0P4VRU1_SCYOL
MTVEGEREVKENSRKYCTLKIARDYGGERVIVMGDMNAHIGILGEQMNRNGEMLDEFVSEMDVENLNETLAWCGRKQQSAIDYKLVNGRMVRVCTACALMSTL